VTKLNEDAQRFLEEPNLAHFVTLMKDGSPQVTPLWIDHDGEHVLMNTALGRQKPLNIERDPRVAVSVVDKDNPFRTLQVRGQVVDNVTGPEAWDHIDKLSEKYTGNRNYPRYPGEERVLFRVRPDHVSYKGA
jgi:PPOX class probable F420-dependent enzyme